MYARKRLDISWLDLTTGLVACAFERGVERQAERVERWFGADSFACLSVRTGLDLYLRVLALPAGSEVLMSALTIPDMWKVVEHHGLVPVPVDIDPRTLAPKPGAWRRACSGRTRLAIVAHLFGTRIELGELLELQREKGVRVLEDCAQAFTGPEWKGDERCDASLFSFGPIKTATALAGGVLCVRDRAVLAQMRALHAGYPLQANGTYARRILKYAGLKAVSTRVGYELFARACAWLGKDIDQVIQGTVRGFKGGDLFVKLRHRPSAPLLALLARRLEQSDGQRSRERGAHAQHLLRLASRQIQIPGSRAPFHSFWVFTLLAAEPEALVADLRDAGFDATRAATLSALSAPPGRPELEPREARAMLARLVYVPTYPEMSLRALQRLAAILYAHARTQGAEESEQLELAAR